MKRKTATLLAFASLIASTPVLAKELPDPCGDEIVRFHVTTRDKQPPPPPPAPGKAQIIFIERVEHDSCLGCTPITTRAGVDGVWVGANQGRSYFAYDVEPGKRQLCADWQRFNYGRYGMASLNAEPGNVYYFLVRVKDRKYKVGEVERHDEFVHLIALGESEGKRLASESDLSVAERSR